MIALLNDLCTLLSQADVDAHRVAAWLGEILHEGELGMPYTVRPRDPHLAGASVLVAQDGYSPLMVELNLAQPYALEALRRAFPDHSSIPRRDGREDLAAFADLPELPFTCTILASHDHGSAMTDFIRVRRDQRIA